MNPIRNLERQILRMAAVGLIALIAIQGLLLVEASDICSSISRMMQSGPENFYEEYPQTRVTSGPYQSIFSTITIQCENYSSLEKAVLLVNGEEVGDFRDKQLTIKVSPGDIVAVDGSYYIHQLVFKVVAVSENVAQPEIGQMIIVDGDVAMVGEVKIK